MGQIFMVHHGDLDQALRRLKQHLSREGVSPGRKFFFEKQSDKKHRKVVETKRKIRKNKIRLAAIQTTYN